MSFINPYLDDLMSEANMRNRYAYIIRLIHPDVWYFFDMDTVLDPHAVMWTSHRACAFVFHDEQSVEEFRADFITPRNTEILRIERKRN